MYQKVFSSIVEKEGRCLFVELQENRKSGVKKICILTRDEQGCCREIGLFTPHDLMRGECRKAIGNVFPELLLSEQEEKKWKNIEEDLKNIFISGTTVAEENTFSDKEVHVAVCEYVKEHATKDCLTLDADKGVCIIDYDCVDSILKNKLNINWNRLEFARMLKRQGMLHEGNDRLAKKVTMSDGKGQYRALVFDIEFKGVLCNE